MWPSVFMASAGRQPSCRSDLEAGSTTASSSSSPSRTSFTAPVASAQPSSPRQALLHLVQSEINGLLFAPDEDSAAGLTSAVRRQLLADACRGRYLVDGIEYCFEKEKSVNGDLGTGMEFAIRLLSAVQRCMQPEVSASECREGAADLVLHLAFLLLTQMGLALAHAACAGPLLALGGGKRSVSYELQSLAPGIWQVHGNFCAHSFCHYQVENHAEMEGGKGKGPEPCDRASSVHRGFVIEIRLSAAALGGITVHVLDAFEDLAIFTEDGLQVNFAAGPSLPGKEDTVASMAPGSMYSRFVTAGIEQAGLLAAQKWLLAPMGSCMMAQMMPDYELEVYSMKAPSDDQEDSVPPMAV